MGDVFAQQRAKQAGSRVEPRADLRPLLQSQKTELVAEITTAIANDFNNIMMAITGYAELELKKLPVGERRSVEHILRNAARAASMVQKLLTLSRNSVPAPQMLDLNGLLAGMSHLLEQLVGDKAHLRVQLEDGIPEISADPTEIEQAILSLVVRARDGMHGRREISIITKFLENGENSNAADNDLLGKCVRVAIEQSISGTCDNGPVSPSHGDLQNRESQGNATLAAVHEILAANGGQLKYSSDEATKTSFRLYFPASERNAVEQSERSSPRVMPFARTVLIVDDDDAVRLPAAEFLMMEGFKVLQANTGAEAINVVLQSRSPLDILVTDVVMPKMNGQVLAEKLLESNPELKVLYMSGDADRARGSEPAGSARTVILRKPFRLDTLKDQIHELLGE